MGFKYNGGYNVVQQSQRKEWRRRQRRRKRNLLIFKILVFILVLSGVGYGGKKLYGIYNAEASKDNSVSEIPNIVDPADNTEETKEPGQTDNIDIPEKPDETKKPDSSEKPDSSGNTDKAETDSSKDPNGPESPDSSNSTDGTKKPDSSHNSDGKEKPDSSEKPDKPEKPATDKSDETKEPDNQKKDDDTAKADDSYFDDAVFVGDSRTEGFGMYSGLKNATFYSEKGLMVDSIFKDKAVKISGDKVTIMEALKKRSFGKVYIMLGVNELGWPYDSVFIEHYKKVIDAIKESQPQAVIYIQSIINVSKEKDKNPPSYINNKQINSRNKLIKKMAEEENVNYLDVNEVLTDSSGNLFADASTDGVHLNQRYCLVWKDYLLKHTIN